MRVPVKAVFGSALLVAGVYAFCLGLGLPDRVASHFGRDGAANGFMGRNDYIFYSLALIEGLPISAMLVLSYLPYLVPPAVRPAHPVHWLSPSRRSVSIAYLSRHGCRLGMILVVFLSALNALVAHANAYAPLRFPVDGFRWCLMGFFLSLGLWIMHIYFHFRTPE